MLINGEYFNSVDNGCGELIGVKELMTILNVGRTVAYNLLKTGEIKSFKIGKVYKIRMDDVKEYIDGSVY